MDERMTGHSPIHPFTITEIMETKYSYKDLDAYKEAKLLVRKVYELLKQFPKEEQYALCDQLRRAVISIPSNLAEGTGRYSTKEQLHFIEIAYGSLLEVECQLDIAHDIKYVSDEQLLEVNAQICKVAALLSGLRNKRVNAHSSTHPLTH